MRSDRRTGGPTDHEPEFVRRSVRPAVRLSFILSLLASPVSAQIPDTLQADSLPRDTVDQTARFLKAQADANVLIPVLPHAGVEGPRPALSRIVIDRDSIDWGIAETLGDLLQRVPGVFLWRGGWLGRPEYPNYQGRGASSVEYDLDGLPLLPVGTDSVAFDPSLMPLNLIERVEIERWPGLLRVHLFTWRNDRRAARSRVGLSSGDRSITRYLGILERRFANGLGFALGGEYFDAPTGSGFSSQASNTQYWVQANYIPSPRWGFQLQRFTITPDRRAFERQAADTIGAPLKGNRRDDQARIFYRPSGGDHGLRVDLLYGRTLWNGEGLQQSISHAGGIASWRGSSLQLGGSLFHRSRWTATDARLNAGWVAPAGLTLSGELGYQQHDHNRTSTWWGGRAGLVLPLGLRLSGSVRIGSIVAAPAIKNDVAQDITDLQGQLSWQRPALGFEVGVTQTGAFRPFAYQPFLLVDSLRPLGRTQWLTLTGRFRPRQWLTLEGWYSDPMGTKVDGLPPTHSYITGTIRSRFLRTFPSGIFDLKLQLGMEAWSDGTIGRDDTGAPITLGGATFFRTLVEIRLGKVILYWDRMNLSREKRSYVPEYLVPRFGSTFGARWEFSN